MRITEDREQHSVIPAQPGWSTVYGRRDDGELFIGAAIIAWHITLCFERGHDAPYIKTRAIEGDGMAAGDGCWGVCAPDGTVIQSGIAIYESLKYASMESMRIEAEHVRWKAAQEKQLNAAEDLA